MAPLMLPTAARWNTLATIEREAREHEAGHAAAAHRLGFEVGEIVLDRWGDFDGELGSVRVKWTRTIDDEEELAFARAVVAAAGPLATDAWGLDRSRQDRRAVEEVRFPAWSPDAWEFVVLHKTERLVRSEAFRRLHRRVVSKLEEIGEIGTLSGADLALTLVRRRPPFQGRRAPQSRPPLGVGSFIRRQKVVNAVRGPVNLPRDPPAHGGET